MRAPLIFLLPHLTDESWLEEGLGASEAFVANGDDLSVRQLVGFFQRGRAGRSLHLLLEVEGHVAELLLDVANDFPLSRRRERISEANWNI